MGDPKPFGPQNSTAANLPPVCSAVALMTKLPPPTNEGCASPPPGGSTYLSVLLAGSDMSGHSSPARWVRHGARREFRRFSGHQHGHQAAPCLVDVVSLEDEAQPIVHSGVIYSPLRTIVNGGQRRGGRTPSPARARS